MGFVMFIVFLSYALGFWFGSRIVLGAPFTLPDLHTDFTVGRMLIVSEISVSALQIMDQS